MWRTSTLALAILTMLGTACVNPRSSAGFRLPPDGDLERGKAAFLELKCYTVRVPVEASRNFEWVANAGLPREVQFGLRFEV